MPRAEQLDTVGGVFRVGDTEAKIMTRGPARVSDVRSTDG
jgi:hypothetical protein